LTLMFLPAPYMALYSASAHAVEGLSETLDLNVPRSVSKIPVYSKELIDPARISFYAA